MLSMKPNLFQIATKELSQDGFFTWLIQWADNSNEQYDKNLHQTAKELVQLLINDNSVVITDVKAHRQWHKIDILVEVNNNTVIAIEDKTNTGAHSNQLERYKQLVEEQYKDKKKVFVYLKTGNESIAKMDKIKEKGYAVVERKAILDMLSVCQSQNSILIDFRDYLNTIEDRTNSFHKYENILNDWRAAEGFYLELQKRMSAKGEWSDWHYVSNKTGGFLGFFYRWISHSGDYTLYIQIENTVTFDRGIKLVIKVGELKPDVPLYTILSELQSIAQGKFGLSLAKPGRYRRGATSTLAVVKDVFPEKQDGAFDINKFMNVLENLEQTLKIHCQ